MSQLATLVIPLRAAVLCVGCEVVYESGVRSCPRCTDSVVIPLVQITDRPARRVPVDDVIHHAGNGLTLGRVLAQRLQTVLAARQYPGLADDAGAIVQSIDDTMQRLRALAPSQPLTSVGVTDGHQR